jgi:hypothetical protein
MPSHLDPSVSALLELFNGPLRDVRFPLADGASLHAAREDVHAARIALAHAETALLAARQSLTDKETHLDELAQRTLAYARVYAQGNAELLAALPAGGRGVVRAKHRERAAAVPPLGAAETAGDASALEPGGARRGRPRKARPQEEEAASAE